ncbi:rhomboid family intramembrane serine protease [Bacillus sp. V59.32b]|nr:rhomboid family intramembrane serine protease [Bacillus sp. V59.32b]
MKVGKALGVREDYIYWSMVKELTTSYDYRVITIAEGHQEIWLETDRDQSFPVIRLMRHDIDWTNWLKRDIERTALNGEQIRKQLYRRPLKALNIYISEFAPVDDYDYLIREPAVNNKAAIHTFIMDVSKYEQKSEELQRLLDKRFIFKAPDDDIKEGQVAYIKQSALSASAQRVKKEQELFTVGKPFFTYVFAVLQIAVFFLMELRGGSTNSLTLIEFGAKYNPLILQGEWWRFFTPIIVHIGLLHLLMNALSLYFLGILVERIYGRSRFLLIYLFAGFAGTLGSFLMNANISAGASGAIFGCFGALLYFGIVHPKLFFRTMGANVIILILFNLIYGFSVEGIDNAGHIGGLIGGFLAAGIVHLPKSKQPARQIIFAAATALLTFWLLQWGYDMNGTQGSAPAGNESVAAQVAQDSIADGEEVMAYEFFKNDTEAPFSFFILENLEYEKKNLQTAEESNLEST